MRPQDTDESRVEIVTAVVRDICASLHGAWAASSPHAEGANLH